MNEKENEMKWNFNTFSSAVNHLKEIVFICAGRTWICRFTGFMMHAAKFSEWAQPHSDVHSKCIKYYSWMAAQWKIIVFFFYLFFFFERNVGQSFCGVCRKNGNVTSSSFLRSLKRTSGTLLSIYYKVQKPYAACSCFLLFPTSDSNTITNPNTYPPKQF